MQRTKNIFGIQRNITYDNDTGLIETGGTLSGTALNLAILIARGFVRGSHRKAQVRMENESYNPPDNWYKLQIGPKPPSGVNQVSEEQQWTSSSPSFVITPRPPAAR